MEKKCYEKIGRYCACSSLNHWGRGISLETSGFLYRFNAHFDKLCKNRREEAYFRPLFLLLFSVKDAHLKRTFDVVSFSAHARKSRTTQRQPTTVFFKISVRRSKYCLEFLITWRRLKISRWPFHSCKIFEVYLINSLRFYEA